FCLQAEDGIRDPLVTGVQTCALPICADDGCQAAVPNVLGGVTVSDSCSATNAITLSQAPTEGTLMGLGTHTITVTATDEAGNSEIGRASCREGVEVWVLIVGIPHKEW